MSAPTDMIERSAFAIYRAFIANAVGTRRQKRGADGFLMWTTGARGERAPLIETPDEAAMRRWQECSELTRQRFRHEASCALEAS